jgi:hypothetical protein
LKYITGAVIKLIGLIGTWRYIRIDLLVIDARDILLTTIPAAALHFSVFCSSGAGPSIVVMANSIVNAALRARRSCHCLLFATGGSHSLYRNISTMTTV